MIVLDFFVFSFPITAWKEWAVNTIQVSLMLLSGEMTLFRATGGAIYSTQNNGDRGQLRLGTRAGNICVMVESL